MKIDAHPERFIRQENWDGDNMGIYIADRVAGKFMQAHRKISAKEWMRRISSVSKVSIEEEDGTPFIGSVNRRASREAMRQYLLMRDGYREKEGDFEQKWEGTNMAMAPKLLLRNGGFEDRSQCSNWLRGRGGMLVDTIRLPASYVKRNSWIKDIHSSTALHMRCIMLGNCGRSKSKLWLQTRICGYGHRWRTLLDVSTPSEMENLLL
jgi:hypothetical protein